jgi:uncharacterized membrane protein
MPVAGGILSLITGLLSSIGGTLVILILSLIFAMPDLFGYGSGSGNFPVFIFWVAFLPYLAISIMAIIGGIYSIKRRRWGLALAGAICAILTMWAWAIGVAAVVFVALARNEFDVSLRS